MRHGLGLRALLTGCVILAAAMVGNPVPAGGMDQESHFTLGGMVPMLGPEDFSEVAQAAPLPPPQLKPAALTNTAKAKCWMPKRKSVRARQSGKAKVVRTKAKRYRAARYRVTCGQVRKPAAVRLKMAKAAKPASVEPAPPAAAEEAEEFNF